MGNKKFILLIVIAILALILISPVKEHSWQWNGIKWVPTRISKNQFAVVNPHLAQYTTGQDCMELKDQQVTIHRCAGIFTGKEWVSPLNWQVKEVVSGDLNHDGIEEFGLLVWRTFKPWPIDKFLPNAGRIAAFHDENDLSCHLILIGWDGEKYRELWAGSALADPISHLVIVDVDRNGEEELAAIEGTYKKPGDGNLTIWKWQGFGFTLINRLDGKFSNFTLGNVGDHSILITD